MASDRAADMDRAGRTTLQRYLETRGLIGGHARTHQRVGFSSADHVRLAASYFRHPVHDAPAVVVLHGFGAHRRKPAYALLADVLAERASVLSVDLRGHGESEGECTMGDRESLDATAAVAWMRARGHDWIALVGVSMGATATLHALSAATAADAGVVISAPGYLRPRPGTEAMQRLQRAWRSPILRRALRRGLGVHVIDPRRWTSPPHPAVAAARIRVPLLIIHGSDDHFFGVEDAEAITAAAGGPATLWIEPEGFGHAEDGLDAAFSQRLARALADVHEHGRFPDRFAG